MGVFILIFMYLQSLGDYQDTQPPFSAFPIPLVSWRSLIHLSVLFISSFLLPLFFFFLIFGCQLMPLLLYFVFFFLRFALSNVCLCLCEYIWCVCRYLWRPEEGVMSLGAVRQGPWVLGTTNLWKSGSSLNRWVLSAALPLPSVWWALFSNFAFSFFHSAAPRTLLQHLLPISSLFPLSW